MADRTKEIKAAVAAREVDTNRVAALRAFKALRDARELVDQVGVLGVVEVLLDAVDDILGPGAVTEILGPDPKVTETMIVARALAEQLTPAMDELLKKLTDLTETVAED